MSNGDAGVDGVVVTFERMMFFEKSGEQTRLFTESIPPVEVHDHDQCGCMKLSNDMNARARKAASRRYWGAGRDTER
jgi:hypothetical protein